LVNEKPIYKSASKNEKVSHHIIEQIRDSILSGKVKTGDRLASEKELLVQFGVSKATLREALRVLEAMGLVEMRKGVSGGIFIARVDMNTTLNSIANFLHFRSVSQYDITMIRLIVEPPVAQIAAVKATADDIDNLKKIIEDPRASISFHRYFGRISGNPLLILIMDFVHNLLRDITDPLGLGNEFYDTVKIHHMNIIDAFIHKDSEKAAHAVTHDLLWIDKFKAKLTNSPPFDSQAFCRERFSSAGDALSIDKIMKQVSPQLGKEIKKSQISFQKVSTGELYLFVEKKNE
jgi:GntR family transcriptional regulator, transcriptional repressor for pyruvate dehydrogenase complex